MIEKLTNELLDASNGKGAAIKKKKMCIAWRKRTRRSRITAGRDAVRCEKLISEPQKSKETCPEQSH